MLETRPSYLGTTQFLGVGDNEDNILMVINRQLRKDCKIIAAKVGAQGVEMMHRESPAPILVDMVLPAIDCWQSIVQLHAPPDRTLGQSRLGECEKVIQAGCDIFNIQLVDLPCFFKKIRALLPGASEI